MISIYLRKTYISSIRVVDIIEINNKYTLKRKWKNNEKGSY